MERQSDWDDVVRDIHAAIEELNLCIGHGRGLAGSCTAARNIIERAERAIDTLTRCAWTLEVAHRKSTTSDYPLTTNTP